MEAKKYLKLITILALAFMPALVFGYDNIKTHPLLTGEAIRLFESNDRGNFTEAEKTQIVQGSKDEDNVPRWLEHFYDPINNRGLNGGQFSTSKKWAHGQAVTGNDYSWENAIYEYVYGDKGKGLYALGHVVHLIQDATVPDHTRDDPHPIIKTYENYAYDQDSVPAASLIYLDPLDAYFDSAASFTNSHFFSDDTILKYYTNPKISKEIKDVGVDGKVRIYGYNNLSKKVALVTNKIGDNGLTEKFYNIYDKNDNKVMADYWNTLSPKAVGYSAGVIKLFLVEVEKEKVNGALKKARMPWWEKLLELVKIRVDELLATVNLSIKETEQNPPSPNPIVITPGLPIPKTGKSKQEELIETRDKLEKLKTDLVEVTNKGEIAILPVVRSVNTVISSLGGEPVNIDAPTTTATTTIVTIFPPTIVYPSDFSQSFATTSIIFSGTASSGLIIFNDFDRAQATTSETGEWQIILDNLPQGSSTIKFFSRDDDGNVSLPTEVNLSIDSLPLTVDFSVTNCANSLSPDFCLLKPTSTLNFIWDVSRSGNYKYDLIRTEKDDEWLAPETISSLMTEKEKSFSPSFNAGDLLREFKWQVIAREASSSEVVASSSEIITIFHPRPIVINEIGWAGTIASELDEWFELRTYLPDFNLKVDNYFITDRDKTWQLNLGGSTNVDGYYLVERGDDNVVSNRRAELASSFPLDREVKVFNPTNIGLKLWHRTGGEEELIDETPVWNENGSASSSLERTWENRVSTDLSTWKANEGCNESDGPCALDRNATTTFGTPGVINAASIVRLW